MSRIHLLGAAALALLFHNPALADTLAQESGKNADKGYSLVNLVANKQIYAPQIVDPHMVNGWGISIRPAGAGGHFWISNTDTGTTSLYIGDVKGTALHQDKTPLITIAAVKGSKEPSHPTGQVFNPSDTDFNVTVEGITGPSKFIFATEDGTIVGWTEKKNEDGTFQRPTNSVVMIDHSKKGAVYKGLAVTTAKDNNRLYAADFGRDRIEVFDKDWKQVSLSKEAFTTPKDIVPKGYGPFNVQVLDGNLFVAYAKHDPKAKEPGEEEKGEGYGRVVEFDTDGTFIRNYEGGKLLNAPWGLAIAPADFGAHSGQLLVGNFGDGHIIAFDRTSFKAADILRRADGTPVEIDGLWGLTFGNGVALGEANHLYFTAGPHDEKDGVFGKIVPNP
jgi:uncharacterized protein (TIGR03118 family)